MDNRLGGLRVAHFPKDSTGHLAEHEGWQKDCTDPMCRQSVLQTQRRGTRCPHSQWITEEALAEHTCGVSSPSSECAGCYPVERIVEPWPCSQCSQEDFEKELEQAEADYREFLWEEYWVNR